MATATGIPIDTSSASVVLMFEAQLLLVNDPAGFRSHLAAPVRSGETAPEAVLRRIAGFPSIRVRSLYAAEYLEQYFDVQTNRLVISPAFVAFVDEPEAITGGRWCSLADALELTPFPNQHALYQHVFAHFVDAKPADWLRVPIE